MFGNVAALEGLHVTGKFRDKGMQHICSRHAAWDPHNSPLPRRARPGSFLGTLGIWVLQGYLAHKKHPPSRTLQVDYT